ncbi:unnamed protein product, partial [Cochlearia groenlandica]
MSLGQNSVSIPTDLITEVFSRLPYKSIARFRCVSKLWGSIPLTTPYFTELFLTRTYARSRLLFLVEQFDGYSFYSSPQPQYPYGKSSSSSSLVVKADFHMKFHGARLPEICGLVSGFIYIRQDWIPRTKLVPLICNPTTRQYAVLPFLEGITYHPRSFLGFDHVDKQFKILTIDEFVKEEDRYKILTLGTEKDSWRKIHCPFDHYPSGDGTCINGVLYYFVGRVEKPYVIVCFDVRSERFKFVHLDFAIPTSSSKLVNYKGKLGVITKRYDYSGLTLGKLCVWVLMDVEREEWSKLYEYTFRENRVVESNYSTYWEDQVVRNYVSVVGVTARGEIVLSKSYREASKPLYVFYFNPERNNRQIVEIQGFEGFEKKFAAVQVFVDYV